MPRDSNPARVPQLSTWNKQEAQLLLGKADRTAYVQSQASDFRSRRESNFSEVTQFYARYVNGTLSRKLQLTLV